MRSPINTRKEIKGKVVGEEDHEKGNKQHTGFPRETKKTKKEERKGRSWLRSVRKRKNEGGKKNSSGWKEE